MNNILQLKGRFYSNNSKNKPGPISLPKNAEVEADHIIELKQQLQDILEYWRGDNIIGGALLSVYYKRIVAKSNRIKGYFSRGNISASDSIRGAKFAGNEFSQHVFTHFVGLDILEDTIRKVVISINIIETEYAGRITHDDIERLNKKLSELNNRDIAKTNFIKIIVDSYYVEKFMIDRNIEHTEEASIVSIYKTGIKTVDLLNKIGINMIAAKSIDDETVLLTPDELATLRNKAPYLIAMQVNDLSKTPEESSEPCDSGIIQIPAPNDEPIIGVIDTLFDERVYFNEWVEYIRKLDENIPISAQDYNHGTEVSSLIVDGPTINPSLDDGCGRFRVRHFGVATNSRFSSFTVIKAIREIVIENRDIKVWNLSLGSDMEINRVFISPEGAELDKLQCEYDVIFVVAGTNKPIGRDSAMLIGSPADSLNSIVVNPTNHENLPTTYHRQGPVLNFFNKPDISYFGGERGHYIRVCNPQGEQYVAGTSYAAPWISRKLAFLIHKIGLNREAAKALLIDAAIGWNRSISCSLGYGVVPQRIEEIVKTHDDEIRFIMTGVSNAYETYTYEIPIPSSNGKQPFFARATLCYFPRCKRSQGVDYTSTEMDIHFGRVSEKDGRTEIRSLDANKQGDAGRFYIPEEHARKIYRKWDNVKHICDVIKTRSMPRKVLGSGMWGLSIRTKERLAEKNGRGLNFGIVITLKEMNGANRIDEFVKLCMVRGWVVNPIDIDNRIEVYQKAEEEITFD